MNKPKGATAVPQPLIAALRAAQKVAVLTGAGISAESGVPTFREAQTGLWAQYDPQELATPEAFRRNPRLVWEWYAWRRELVAQAQPNPGHLALAALEQIVPQLTLITQNVDGLHARAGSQRVIELHGNIMRTKCFADGRIHTSFSQTGAITGRLASSNPNLQNIPIRSDVGQQIRRGFVARPGWQFLACDYSQVELRILAHVCQDAALLEAFRSDQDIHRTTAAAVYNIPVEQVTYNQRRFAKAVNFGLIYGMGAFRLARDSELTLAEAENYIKEYFNRFPGIRDYLEETKLKARQQGYVETLLGRRRYFPVFKSTPGGSNRQAWLRAEREAVNHPIQGTAADIVKIAMLRLHKALLAGYRARMLLQVHDELLLEVPDDEMTAVKPLVIDTMSDAFQLDVPLKVEAATGHNWLELKD